METFWTAKTCMREILIWLTSKFMAMKMWWSIKYQTLNSFLKITLSKLFNCNVHSFAVNFLLLAFCHFEIAFVYRRKLSVTALVPRLSQRSKEHGSHYSTK